MYFFCRWIFVTNMDYFHFFWIWWNFFFWYMNIIWIELNWCIFSLLDHFFLRKYKYYLDSFFLHHLLSFSEISLSYISYVPNGLWNGMASFLSMFFSWIVFVILTNGCFFSYFYYLTINFNVILWLYIIRYGHILFILLYFSIFVNL